MQVQVSAVRIAEAVFFLGLGAQGYGIYALWGVAPLCVIMGTQLALVGLLGVVRNAG